MKWKVESENVISSGIELNPLLAQTSVCVWERERERERKIERSQGED
jgi:hypothetical protein